MKSLKSALPPSVRTGAIVAALVALNATPSLQAPAQAQDAAWPDPGIRIRVTSLPGPPHGVETALQLLGLSPADTPSARRAEDGRVRFSGILAYEGNPFGIQQRGAGQVVELTLADLSLVESYNGTVSNSSAGLKVGALVGAGLGALSVSSIGEDPNVAEYLTVAAVVAIPFAALGALFGALLRSDVWMTVYEAVP